MNKSILLCAAAPAHLETPGPLQRMLALVARMKAAFPCCHLSLGALRNLTLAQLGLQRRWTAEAHAIDDEMEKTAPLLWQCLQNDPPSKRRAVWTAWQETHHRTQALAEKLNVEAMRTNRRAPIPSFP